MKRIWFAALLPLLFAAAAEQPGSSKPGDGVSASRNIRGAEYPKIDADLRVTFRIKAPDAQKVEFGFFSPQRIPRTRATMASGPRPPTRRFRGSITTGCSSTART